MQPLTYDPTFAALHGFIPLEDEAQLRNPQAPAIQADKELPKLPVETRFQRNKTFWWIFGALCLSEFLRAIDAVVLPVILPGIVHDLNASSSQGYMSGSSFLLCQTVFQPVYAGVAGLLGNKRCMQLALVVFAGGSILTGLAQNPYWIIGARALQGVGAGGMDMMCSLIFSDMVPLSDRGMFSGYMQLFAAVGLVTGMIVAAIIETSISWRWVFFVNPFLTIPPFAILTIFLRNRLAQGGLRLQMKTVDWSGMLLISLACMSTIYALLAGGAVYPWASAPVLVPLILGCCGIILFVLHQGFVVQRFTSAEPLMPLRLFKHRTSATGFAVAIVHSTLIAAVLNFFFIYIHVSSSLTIIQSSVTMLPTSFLLFTSAAVTGVLTSRIKKYRIFVIIGGVLLNAGMASFIHLGARASRIEQIFIQVVPAIGAGMIFPARMLATQAAQDERDIPQAAATLAFFFNLGQCFALPIGATTFQTVWDYLVREDLRSGAIPQQFVITSHQAEGSGELIRLWSKPVADIYRNIMAVSVSRVWIVLTVFAGVILLLGVVMEETPLDNQTQAEPVQPNPVDEFDDLERLIKRRGVNPEQFHKMYSGCR